MCVQQKAGGRRASDGYKIGLARCVVGTDITSFNRQEAGWGMGKKTKGAKVLGKYAAPRLKRSDALPSASHSADVSRWLSSKSPQSVLSALSHSSLLSFVSVASIGSAGSILSIGSVGSILSIGSAGSILSIGSAGSILSIGKAGAAPARGSVEPEIEILLEEEDILAEEMPPPEEPRPPGEMPPEPMP